MNVKGIVIDAGHGGSDPGAINGNLEEKDFNLRASKYMYDRFKELGIPVKLTRSTDETLPRKERINRILNAFGNRNDVILISNHINAGGGDGAEVVYALRNKDTLAKSVLNNIAKTGQNVRKYYQRRLPEDQTKDYYFIHRETGKLEPILVEYGFIDSKKDDIAQLQNNIEDYAEAVVKAVADYTNTPYKAKETTISDNEYIVKKGDSLYSIANKYNISVENLKQANNLSGNIINVGQILNIPNLQDETNKDYKIYTVAQGDNLWNIARKYGVSVNDIVSFNNLGTTFLKVGDQLLIPNLNIEEENKNTNDNITYIVKSGDTLWSIAKKYNINVNDLKNANNLTSNTLRVGQELIIPKTTEYKTYIVKKGDSLWKIARDNNINFNDIIQLNNLKNDTLQIGQTILLP